MPIELILAAVFAFVLAHKLYQTLGRRHGDERQRPNPLARHEEADKTERSDDNVVPLPGRTGMGDGPVETPANGPLPLRQALAQIHRADPSFDEQEFLGGACQAFEMIVTAFNAGDRDTLKPLVNEELFNAFSSAIEARENAGETVELRFDGPPEADLAAARMEGPVALLTVRFHSRQAIAIRNAEGQLIDGSTEVADEMTDLWTFARNTTSSNPNWVLVETDVAENGQATSA